MTNNIKSPFLTLEKAIELGEYDPEKLSHFAEWQILSRHAQFELIKQALENRKHQLWQHWAELNNQLNFSKKPYLKTALQNIQEQIDQWKQDNERLYIEYSS